MLLDYMRTIDCNIASALSWSLIACAVLGCKSSVNCTGELRDGLVVEVDLEHLDPCDGVRVTVTDGKYHEELHRFDCVFSGARERPGAYDITIADAQQSLTIHDVIVKKATCHVEQRKLEVAFTTACVVPQEDAGTTPERMRTSQLSLRSCVSGL